MKVFVVLCAVSLSCISMLARAQINGFNDDVVGIPNDFDVGMSNFGSFINKQVEEQVRGISEKVNKQVLDINQDIQQRLLDLGSNLQIKMNGISNRMEDQLRGLGKRIRTQVQDSMKPLNAMMIQSAMAQGFGGITVATFGDKITMMIINGIKYSCPGEIVNELDSVKCTRKLVTTMSTEDNICTESSYSRVNNMFCFGNYASFQCIADSCQCNGGKMYTLDSLRNLCGDSYATDEYVKYEYYPNKRDPNNIPVPNSNKFVVCNNPEKDYCVWSGNGFIMAVREY